MLLTAFCLFPAPGNGLAYADDDIFRNKLISLGTATTSGTFHVVGTRLCDLVNQERATSLIRCVPYNTVGAEYNAKAVANGDMAMALTSAEMARTEFLRNVSAGKQDSKLRAVMSLYSKPIMVIANRDAKITDITQLAGHSINIGNAGSGQRNLVNLLLKNLGLSTASFSGVTELNTTKMGDAFCRGEVEVIVESLGNPSPFYKRMIEECNGVIVSFTPAVINTILSANPLLFEQAIPGGIYRGHSNPVATVGDRTLLVTSTEVSDEAVRRFVGSIVNNFPVLQQSSPELNELDPEMMFSLGISIPLHPGVVNYLNSRKSR